MKIRALKENGMKRSIVWGMGVIVVFLSLQGCCFWGWHDREEHGRDGGYRDGGHRDGERGRDGERERDGGRERDGEHRGGERREL